MQKKNPLRNKQIMLRLNPYASTFIKEKIGQQKLNTDEPKALPEQFKKLMSDIEGFRLACRSRVPYVAWSLAAQWVA